MVSHFITLSGFRLIENINKLGDKKIMGLNNFTNPNSTTTNNNNPNGGIPLGLFAGNAMQQPKDVSDFFIDYNARYINKERVLFRDSVIQQLLSIVIGKDKPNALLVGPAGTGKTAIVETIANMLATNDSLIPSQLQGFTIYELPLANIVAGASLVGQLEENIQMIIKQMEDPTNQAILFIDEIHQLVNASQTYDKIAQILKPALARGNLRVIGATTTQEATNLMKDPAFNRRFSRVLVDELTPTQTTEILKKAKPSFIKHYQNVMIDDGLLDLITNLADQYRPAGSHRPDNALTLFDRTFGEAVVNRNIEIKRLEQLVFENPNDTVSQALLQALQSNPVIPITDNQIKKTAIGLATGNQKKDSVDFDHIKDHFAYIKGQDEAVRQSIRMIQRTEFNLFPKVKPTTMLFIGPSGVGKTEIAKLIANELTGHKPIMLNMTEYSSSATINRIIGSPAGYIGSESKAEKPFDSLESNPFAVIILDEFEKAHPAVQRLFFSAFDEGTLTDNMGKIIDFSKAIIIATTNAGHQVAKRPMGFATNSENSVKASIKDLSDSLDVALLNRFKYLINFHSISEEVYTEILIDTYHKEVTRILKDNPRFNLPANIPDDKLTELVKNSYVEEFGARPVFETISKYIENLVFPAI